MGGVTLYLTRDVALLVGANLIPLLGVLLAGWDPFTLLMLYWFESAVIGFWVCVAVATSRDQLSLFQQPGAQAAPSRIGEALLIAAHAGVFMFVHLFFLLGLSAVANLNRADDAGLLLTLLTLLVERGLWLPLAGLFLIRGLVSWSDRMAERPVGTTVIGFYLRILVMQFVILLGGLFIAIFASSLVPLILLIGLRLAIDIGIGPIVERIGATLAQAKSAGRAQAG